MSEKPNTKKRSQPFYQVADADVLRQARELTGLEEEITLLRVRLRGLSAMDEEFDERRDRLMLQLVSALTRALLAQEKLSAGGTDEQDTHVARLLVEQFGHILGEGGAG